MFDNIKSYSEIKKDFYIKYQTQILPYIQQFEQERKTNKTNAIILALLSAVIGLCCIFCALFLEISNNNTELLLRLSLIFILGAFFIWSSIKKSFEIKIKEKIMPIVCSCFKNLSWSNGYYMLGYLFKKSGIIPQFDCEYYDDILKGTHKGVKFEIIEGKHTVRGGKYEVSVFDGVILNFKMNKKFTSHTLITSDTILHKSPISNLKHTVLEDPLFEKKFDVYTNDEVDARYLITPAFMQRLIDLKTAFYADKIQCAFFENFLIISLNTSKDLFSLCSLLKPIDDNRQYFEMFEEIISIIKLIDHFKLNEKTGL